MKSYEMVEALSTKANVSLEQAKDALEHSNWDILDAAIYIERRKNAPGVPPAPNPAPGPAYFVSGKLNETEGRFASPGFGRHGSFDPRTDFNKPQGANCPPPYPPHPPVPPYAPGANPYAGAPNGGVPPYSVPPKQFENEPVGEFVGRLAGMLENVVNHIFKTSFVVRRHERVIFSVPLLIFIILVCVFLWAAIPLLVLGIAFDCKYSLGIDPKSTQPVSDFIDQTVNSALNTAERAKESFMNETQNARAAYEQSKKEFTEDFKKGKESVRIDLTKHDDTPRA